jgi:hypothetical protein
VKDNVPAMCESACKAPLCPKPSKTGAGDSFLRACEKLAAPLASVNTLKIRTKKHDMPEGYTFGEFFGDHKPYMRWWDTGNEAAVPGVFTDAAGSIAANAQNLCSVEGSNDTIIGVGGVDRSCKYGGWGTGADRVREIGCGTPETTIKIPPVDSNAGWEELKLYQTYAYNRFHLNCLAQNEKLFKAGSAEEWVARMIGRPVQGIDKQISQTVDTVTYPDMWRGYISASDTKNPDGTPKKDSDPAERFPYFGRGKDIASAKQEVDKGVLTGLDNAQVGDVIYLPESIQNDPNNPRLPVLAVVVEVQTKKNTPNITPGVGEYVKVKDYNYGKYPDACGNTNQWGIGPERYIYKVSRMPAQVYEQIYYSKKPITGLPIQPSMMGGCDPATASISLSDENGVYFTPAVNDDNNTNCVIEWSTSCTEDPDMEYCEAPLNEWNSFQIFRPCLAGGLEECVNPPQVTTTNNPTGGGGSSQGLAPVTPGQ